MCETVDRFVPPSIDHIIIVPSSDVAMFSVLRSSRRQVVSVNAFEPRWFLHLPQASERWRKALHLPRQEIILTPYSQPIRGWIAQQIRKIAASADIGWDVVVHVDCDVTFIRPLGLEPFIQGAKVRFYRNPNAVETNLSRPWHLAACELLGLPPSGFLGADYICHLPIWRRSIAKELQQRIADTTGRDWRIALARKLRLSEYILYGAYSDFVSKNAASLLFPTSEELCVSCWENEQFTAEFEQRCVDRIEPQHLTFALQSTMLIPLDGRKQLVQRIIAQAAWQDRGGGHD
jgi:hypothetical protein